MRILYFYQYFGTARGCWSTRAHEFARRWVRAGDTVTVVTSVYDRSDLKPRSFLSRETIDGIDVLIVNVKLSNTHGFMTRVMSFAAYATLASWYALTQPADVVVASSGPITVAVPGLVARYLRRKPFIFEVRDLWPEGAIQLGALRSPVLISLARALERISYRAATRVVALSPGMADWIRSRHRIDKIDVVPNASDNEIIDEITRDLRPQPIEKKLVVYAGTLGLIDGCEQLLDMAAALQLRGADDIEVCIIGDGRERDQLVQRAQDLRLTNVRFLGRMPRHEVFTWLTRATCGLFVCKNVPFLDTASPNKLFDAFAAGIPVVQTTQGWIKTLFEREGCGLNSPPQDPDALADAVLRVVRDKALHQRLSASSKRVGQQLFDRELLANRMHEVLRVAAGTPR